MSWFYPLQKLFGYEVGPEDPLSIDIAQQKADEATKKAAVWEERNKDKRYIPSWERIPRNITRRRSERKQDTLLRKQENIQAGRHTDRDMDILISRQKDPNIREYQEKAIAEKRFQDTAFKLGVGPHGQSVYSITDPYMPTIAGIQKQHKVEPNQIQAAVVKEIDAWNQANRIRNRRNEFRGPMPSPKRLMGDKYDKTKRYEWQNTGKSIASILDLSEKDLERFKDEDALVFYQGAYSPVQDRIEWKEPITNDERMTIAHEQLHRFIKKHPSGKAFRDLDGDHELFVRAYTHLLDGGVLDDPSLRENLEKTVGKYSDTNLDRFLKDMPQKIKAFERSVLGSDYTYDPNRHEGQELEEIVVTGYRDAIDNQMEQLLSSNKREVRAIRNNNPFNLKYTEIKWDGKLPLDKETEDTFERFDSNLMGMRAGIINTLTHHIKYGDDTIEKLITRHAPSNENDTKNFINFVSKNMGIEPNQKIDLKNKEVLYEYAKAVVTMEGFKSDELDSIIYDAIELGYKQKKINNLTD
tara:strand:- start:334 stop:1908 length:1575 start_codon:yes stop_codon:yes gene_type:complete